MQRGSNKKILPEWVDIICYDTVSSGSIKGERGDTGEVAGTGVRRSLSE